MQIEVAKVFDVIVMRLVGSFNEEVVLEKDLAEYNIDNGPKVLINFSEVDYINSKGLRSLAKLNQFLAANSGDLRLCSLTHNVRQLFKFANLHNGYHIYNSEDEGIISFYNTFTGFDIIAGVIYSS